MSCSRRTLLGGTAAGLALGGGLRAASPAPFATTAIDVHHHFLPPFYKPLAKGWLDKFATGVAAVMAWTPQSNDTPLHLLDTIGGRARTTIDASGFFE